MQIDLYPSQDDFVHSDDHFAGFIGGIGSGKSYAGGVRALLASLGHIGGKSIPVPNLGFITAPTYPMLRDATLRTFQDIARPFIADFSKTDGVMRMSNGSEILFRSADNPERLRGANLSWWYGDEAALYEHSAWKIMLGRLRQHGRQGYAWIATTPKGRNWIYQEFVQQQRRDYRIYKARTHDNIFLDKDFVHSLEIAYTGDFAAQELEGAFVAFEGLIYPEFRRDVHLVSSVPDTFKYVVAGVDWGYANPGVIIVYGVDGDGRMYGIHEEYQRARRIEEWARLAAQLKVQYAIEAFYCDPSEPDFIRAFQDENCNAYEANNEVLPGIQAVKARLAMRGDGRPRISWLRSCMNMATEMEQYQWMEHKDGIRDKPKKTNDHAQDASRYAVMGVETSFGLDMTGAMTYADDNGFSTSAY